MPPVRGLREAVGVVTVLQLYRSFGKIACRHNPQSASLTAPCRGGYQPPAWGTRAFWNFNHFPKENTIIVHCQLSIVHYKESPAELQGALRSLCFHFPFPDFSAILVENRRNEAFLWTCRRRFRQSSKR